MRTEVDKGVSVKADVRSILSLQHPHHLVSGQVRQT